MPILFGSGNTPGCVGTFPTAVNVVDSVATDLLNRIAAEDPILLDYINRVQLQLLRVSRWKFLQSPPQRFVTQLGRSDYWVGPSGLAPIDTVDTGLNISNLGNIKSDTFYDRTNFRLLKRTNEQLLSGTFTFRDGSSRLAPPRMWRNAPDTPCEINLYPAPDNQNIYQPIPEPPALQAVVGGALPSRIYLVRTTFVDSLGNESAASQEGRVFLPAGFLLVVQPPQEIPHADNGVQYNNYNVYVFNAGTNVNLTTGGEILVTSSPLVNTLPYQEPPTGFVAGMVSYPTTNSITPMGGYLIEFRYFQAKPQVTSLSTPLLIPIDYFDVLVAGVNYFTAQFLKDESAQMYWQQEYQTGITGMIRDKNLFPAGTPAFMAPDPATQQLEPYYGYDTVDQSNFPFSGG